MCSFGAGGAAAVDNDRSSFWTNCAFLGLGAVDHVFGAGLTLAAGFVPEFGQVAGQTPVLGHIQVGRGGRASALPHPIHSQCECREDKPFFNGTVCSACPIYQEYSEQTKKCT